MHKLSGKTAVITGGSSGIGLAAASAFVAEGARVLIFGRREDRIEAAIQQLGNAASGFVGDVENLADLDALAEEARRRFGKIDVFFANAGVNELAAFGDVTERSYDRLFRVNTKGVFFSVQMALPAMDDGASIILTGSIASSRAMDGHAVYAGTKGAIRSFARTWARDLSARRIRVNVLSPGPVVTEMVQSLGLSTEQRSDLDAAVSSMVPMGRWGTADEIAKAATFLASDDSSFITGSELFVDGGLAQL